MDGRCAANPTITADGAWKPDFASRRFSDRPALLIRGMDPTRQPRELAVLVRSWRSQWPTAWPDWLSGVERRGATICSMEPPEQKSPRTISPLALAALMMCREEVYPTKAMPTSVLCACPRCKQPGRRLETLSRIAPHDYCRCDACAHVWSTPREECDPTTDVTDVRSRNFQT
jgi:hypothetical protein